MNSLKWKERKGGKERGEGEREREEGVREREEESMRERERWGSEWVREREQRKSPWKTDVPKLYDYNECEHSVRSPACTKYQISIF